LRSQREVQVAAIIKDIPQSTNFPFELLVSLETIREGIGDSFGGVGGTVTFVQIPKVVPIKSLAPALNAFNEKYMEAAWKKDFVSMYLQPLNAVHFDERFSGRSYSYRSSKPFLWTLSLIGLFMILIACVNFVNLATAKAINKSKEIGMRKILGGSRMHIVKQFMSESFLLALFSLVVGIGLANIGFTWFSDLTRLNVGNDFAFSSDLVLFLLGLLVFITLAIGLYPSLVLSRFKPLAVIRRSFQKTTTGKFNVRQALITFQLTTAQALVIGALIITCQIQYFQNKDLGFNKEAVLGINFYRDQDVDQKQTLKNKIQQLAFVEELSLTSSIPMTGNISSTSLDSKESEVKERFSVEYVHADNDYVKTMDMQLLAGRAEIAETDVDTLVRGFVVNETLIDRLAFGTPAEAIGKQINIHGYEATIIGVVKDYHTKSLHDEIKPVGICYGIRDFAQLGIRYQTNDMQSAISQLEEAWASVFPDRNFDFYFQDESLGEMYETEAAFSQMIQLFTLIAILIACIGLISLSAYSSNRRFKEIGVRKVLGASVSDILLLMSKEFFVLTLISFLISIPIALYFTADWLNSFAYSVEVQWWMLAIGGVLALIVTLVTVGFQSIKAAMVNPVQSLRSE